MMISQRFCLIGTVLAACLVFPMPTPAQEGRAFIVPDVHFPALEDNLIGDPATRPVLVYLPPSYDSDPDRRYPVVYWFNGFGVQHPPSIPEDAPSFMDRLIAAGSIEEMIFVSPETHTRYGGSYPTEATVFGDYDAYLSRDLVQYVDANYRTIAAPAGRGLIGYSMGGNSVILLAMNHPEVFSAVYSMEGGPRDFDLDVFTALTSATVIEATEEWGEEDWEVLSRRDRLMFRASFFSPNPDRPPLFIDWPWRPAGDRVEWIEEVEQRWRQNEPVSLVRPLEDNLRQLRAIGFDGATYGEAQNIRSARTFHDALTRAEVPHRFVVFSGNHGNHFNQQRDEVAFPFVWRALAGFHPSIAQATPDLGTAQVGQPRSVEVRVVLEGPLEATGAFPSMSLDLSPLGLAPVSLFHDGQGTYTYTGEIVPLRNGRHRLPVLLDGEENPYTIISIPMAVWPAPDGQPIFADGPAPGWDLSIPAFNQAMIDPQATDQAFEGQTSLKVQTEGGFTFRWVPAAPVEGFGYSLRFAFLPQEVEGVFPLFNLRLKVGDGVRSIKLIGGDLEGIGVNLEEQAWQVVDIPWDRVDPNEPVHTFEFTSNLKGTFYLDDIRLVPQTAPPAVTAVVEERQSAVPDDFTLSQNYPNPFNPATTIRFDLPQSEEIDLAVYNLTGQKVATLAHGLREAGTYTLRWDGRDDDGRGLASGVYLYRLEAGERVETRKLLLLR